VKILIVFGTRPEAIKMAPVILALKADPAFECIVLATAQHRELLDQVLGLFNITPDYDLDAMEPNQTLPKLTAKLTIALDDCLAEIKPDVVLAQGDTTTVMVSALAAFYRKIPYGHIEAGLRTHDLQNPFPEEMNRIVAGHLARWHFAPTTSTRDNLLAEGIADEKITVSGNTVIDALYDVASKPDAPKPDIPVGKRMILVTAHRRENFGKPFENICRAIRAVADEYPDTHFFYPVHPNPNIKSVVDKLLGDHPQITLSEPLDYLPFVGAMKSAYFILSDSGGVQEEAPALGKPVLVLRNETERPEAIDHGSVKLVGTDFDVIVKEAKRLLDDPKAYEAMAIGVSPYGDGKAAGRIVDVLKGPWT
jgi:UDP-N-acetylglucosamine 2-epimerase (non-hydrolysing)